MAAAPATALIPLPAPKKTAKSTVISRHRPLLTATDRYRPLLTVTGRYASAENRPRPIDFWTPGVRRISRDRPTFGAECEGGIYQHTATYVAIPKGDQPQLEHPWRVLPCVIDCPPSPGEAPLRLTHIPLHFPQCSEVLSKLWVLWLNHKT